MRTLRFLNSLRLTAVLLTLAMVLVFVGTLAQVEQGLYQAQARYFRSLFVYWAPAGGPIRVPIFPGGYLLGMLMIANLAAVGATRLRPLRKKWGLLLIHAGLILLLLGQLFTDMLADESALRFMKGETKAYSEDFHSNELALIDTTDAESDRLVSVPERQLRAGGEIVVPGTPFTVAVRRYWVNAELKGEKVAGAEAPGVTQGVGVSAWVVGRPAVTGMDDRNLPAAVVEISGGGQPLGSWLVSGQIAKAQSFVHEGRTWELSLRPLRHYTPFSLTLLELRHEVYKGTEIPRNFSSLVQIKNPETGEDRTALIWMNNPLRYGGNTYYQYQMSTPTETSTLQVVRNPGWLTPYISCVVISIGLVWQFMSHLVGFLSSRLRHEK